MIPTFSQILKEAFVYRPIKSFCFIGLVLFIGFAVGTAVGQAALKAVGG